MLVRLVVERFVPWEGAPRGYWRPKMRFEAFVGTVLGFGVAVVVEGVLRDVLTQSGSAFSAFVILSFASFIVLGVDFREKQ